MQRESPDEQKLREQGYIRIERFCSAMDKWAHVCQKELPTDDERHRRWRKEFGEHWQFIRLAIAKSCLLDRLIYGGEQLRKEMCPTHKGQWSGCNISGKKPCECQHDTCITGWLPNLGDPKSQASFKVILSSLLKGGQGSQTASDFFLNCIAYHLHDLAESNTDREHNAAYGVRVPYVKRADIDLRCMKAAAYVDDCGKRLT